MPGVLGDPPADDPLLPRPICAGFERASTFTPAAANAYAVAQPVSPPPMMTTSIFSGPRYFGSDGTRDFGNRSTQGERPYFVTAPPGC